MKKMITMLLALCLFAICLAGCQKKPVEKKGAAATKEPALSTAWDNDLASVKGQADAIRASLEKEPLTQNEMNLKSTELRNLWNAALSRLLAEARQMLPEAEMEALTAEQNAWAEAMEKAAEAAGKEAEGGSMHPLVVNSEAASLIEARVYELYDRLKSSD